MKGLCVLVELEEDGCKAAIADCDLRNCGSLGTLAGLAVAVGCRVLLPFDIVPV
jgi:hypothetical protein